MADTAEAFLSLRADEEPGIENCKRRRAGRQHVCEI